jgi:PAS domain S-box-containing protein
VLQNVVVNKSDVIRILHVDDDSSQGDFLNYFLPVSDGSFMIQPICDPGKVLDELRRNRYDCVVTDYQMPEINGIELAAMIRKEFEVPIIIYTGQGSEEVAEAAFSVGIDDYLRKEMDPSHYQVLAKRIRSVVEKKRIDTLYKTVIEQTSDALLIFVDNKVVYANKALLDLLKLDEVSQFEKEPFRFFVEGDRDRAKERLQEVMSTGKSDGYHRYQLQSDRGDKLYVEVSTSPVTYNGKKGIICFARDITEKYQLEEDKKETQERLESLIKLAPDGIVTVDLNGTVTSVNPAFSKLTGFEDEEIVGVNLLSLPTLRKSDFLRHFKLFRYIMKGKLPPPFELVYKRKDGTKGWAEAHACFIDFKGKKEILAIIREITERKQMELVKKNKLNDLGLSFKQPTPIQDVTEGQRITDLVFLINDELMDPLNDLNEFIKELKNDPERIEELVPTMEKQVKASLEFLGDVTKKIVDFSTIPEIEAVEQENVTSQTQPA